MTSEVDLGILDECEAWFLTSKFFPSKVGGKPAWLDLKELPSAESLQCEICKEPCVLLCQVYAPIDEKPTCFHRTLFLFTCLNGSCCEPNKAKNLKIFRSQLPRHNDFYSPDPPEEKDDENIPHPLAPPLCLVCGCVGRSQCGGCHAARYCSRGHQTADWRAGHKPLCREIVARRQAGLSILPTTISRASQMILLREWLMDMEPEPALPASEETGEQAEQRRLAEYQDIISTGRGGSLENVPDSELMMYGGTHDKTFQKFSKRVASNPQQVLRFDRGGQPLWIASHPLLLPEQIPTCQYCNSPRVFEFQVMPQLLNSLNIDTTEHSLDWGVICVYSCKESCNDGPAYKEEFIYKQDISNDHVS